MSVERDILQKQAKDLAGNIGKLHTLTSELTDSADLQKESEITFESYKPRPFVRDVPILCNMIVEPWRETEKLLQSSKKQLDELSNSRYQTGVVQSTAMPNKLPKPSITGLKSNSSDERYILLSQVESYEDRYDELNEFLLEMSPELESEYGASPVLARKEYEQEMNDMPKVTLEYRNQV